MQKYEKFQNPLIHYINFFLLLFITEWQIKIILRPFPKEPHWKLFTSKQNFGLKSGPCSGFTLMDGASRKGLIRTLVWSVIYHLCVSVLSHKFSSCSLPIQESAENHVALKLAVTSFNIYNEKNNSLQFTVPVTEILILHMKNSPPIVICNAALIPHTAFLSFDSTINRLNFLIFENISWWFVKLNNHQDIEKKVRFFLKNLLVAT